VTAQHKLTFSLPSRNSDPDPFASRCWPSGQVCNKQQGVAGSYRSEQGPRIVSSTSSAALKNLHLGWPEWPEAAAHRLSVLEDTTSCAHHFLPCWLTFVWFFSVLTQMSSPPPTPNHQVAKPSDCAVEPLSMFKPRTTTQPWLSSPVIPTNHNHSFICKQNMIFFLASVKMGNPSA